MSLGTMPPDVTGLIVENLDASSKSCLACVSKAMRADVGNLPVSLSIHAKTPLSVRNFVEYAAGRMFRLRSSSIVANHHIVERLSSFSHMKHLKLRNCVFPAAHAIASLPSGLVSLFVHKVRVSNGASSKFNTSQIDRLTNLEQLTLEFGSDFERVTLDHRGVGLKTLTIRAPDSYIVVRRVIPPPETLLRLESEIVVARGKGRLGAATHTHIITHEFPPSRRLFDHGTCESVKTLTYTCPSRHWVPELRQFTNLERLSVKLDLAIVDPEDFLYLKRIESVSIKNRFGYGSAPMEEFRGFPAGFDLRVTVNGSDVESGLFL